MEEQELDKYENRNQLAQEQEQQEPEKDWHEQEQQESEKQQKQEQKQEQEQEQEQKNEQVEQGEEQLMCGVELAGKQEVTQGEELERVLPPEKEQHQEQEQEHDLQLGGGQGQGQRQRHGQGAEPSAMTTAAAAPPPSPLPPLFLPCILCHNSVQPSGAGTPYLLECGHILCALCLGNVSSINDATSVHQLIPPTSLRCAECFTLSTLPLTKHYALIRTFLKQQSQGADDIGKQPCFAKCVYPPKLLRELIVSLYTSHENVLTVCRQCVKNVKRSVR
jgi:hypothetical protein